MNDRSAHVLGLLMVLAACQAAPPAVVEKLTTLAPARACDLGILRGTSAMRCDDELRVRREFWGSR